MTTPKTSKYDDWFSGLPLKHVDVRTFIMTGWGTALGWLATSNIPGAMELADQIPGPTEGGYYAAAIWTYGKAARYLESQDFWYKTQFTGALRHILLGNATAPSYEV